MSFSALNTAAGASTGSAATGGGGGAGRTFNHLRAEDLDAGTLNFGKDFNEVHCLTVSDVNILLVQLREQKVKLQGEKAINDIFRRAYEHAQVFGRFRSQNMLVEARSALQQNEAGAGLSSFEHAQLLNLCPATVDEAKSLIPSLIHRISDDQLRDLLLDINTIRNTATSL